MRVSETFFSIDVGDMERATAFYVGALGAALSWASPQWTSVHVAGVRLGLFLNQARVAGRIGLHFAVDDLAGACGAIERAGGAVTTPAYEPAPGVVIAEVRDTEGNGFTLRQA